MESKSLYKEHDAVKKLMLNYELKENIPSLFANL